MAETHTVTDAVRAILEQHGHLAVDLSTVGDQDDLYAVGMTSHASVTVMLACEDAYDVEFPQPLMRKSTFASVAAISEALTGLGAGAAHLRPGSP